MAESSVWMRNIDKISYLIAGVLVVGLLAFATVQVKALSAKTTDLAASSEALSTKRDEQKVTRSAGGESELLGHLEAQWSAVPAGESPGWITNRLPILVRKQKERPPEPAIHKPGSIARIEFHRDSKAQKPFLRVTGVLSSENKDVTITKVMLYRAEKDSKGDLSKPLPVKGFEATGDFTFDDKDVKAGKAYAYQLETRAESVDPALHPLADAVAMSDLAGPTLDLPYDFHLSLTFVNSVDGVSQASAKKTYWDYKSSKLVEGKGTFKEGDYLDPEKRWQVTTLVPASGREPAFAQIRDAFMAETVKITQRTRRSVAGWEPFVNGAPAEAAEPPADDAVAQPGAAKGAGAKKPGATGKQAPAAAGSDKKPAAGSDKKPAGKQPATPDPKKPASGGAKRRTPSFQ